MASLREHGWIEVQLRWKFGPTVPVWGFGNEGSPEMRLEWIGGGQVGRGGGIVKSKKERRYQCCSGWGLYGIRGGFIQEVFEVFSEEGSRLRIRDFHHSAEKLRDCHW
jgi:hypothetical protein